MPKLWLALGIVSLFIAAYGYIDQEVFRHAGWSWRQFMHTESVVAIALCVGIALLVVAIVEFINRRRITR